MNTGTLFPPPRRLRGYVAITSAIIMGVVILVIIMTIGLGSFLNRSDISSAHYKGRSRALAEACIETARLKLAQNGSYGGDEIISVASDTCRIISVVPAGGQKIISTQSQYQGSFTNLRVTVNAGNLSVVGWEELKSF